MLRRQGVALGFGLGLFTWCWGIAGLSCGADALRWHFAKGEGLRYRVATNTTTHLGTSDPTQDLVLETRWRVVNVHQGVAKIEISLDRISFRTHHPKFGVLAEYRSSTRDATGRLPEPARKALAALLNALLDKPITAQIDSKGKTVEITFPDKWTDAFQGQAAGELSGLFGYWLSDPGIRSQLFMPIVQPPERPPTLAETWTRERELVVWDFPEKRAVLAWTDEYTYEGEQRRGTASLAKFAVTRTETLTVTPRDREPRTQRMTSQGWTLFDRAKGRTVECRLEKHSKFAASMVTVTLVNGAEFRD
jgi:hypothetical protein